MSEYGTLATVKVPMDDRDRSNPYAVMVAEWNWKNFAKVPNYNGYMYVGQKEYFPTLHESFLLIGASDARIDIVYEVLLRMIRDDADLRKMSYYGDVTIYTHRQILQARAKPRLPLLIVPTKSGCETAVGAGPLSVENALRVARMGQLSGEYVYGILMVDGSYTVIPTLQNIRDVFEASENFNYKERELKSHSVDMCVPNLEQFLSGIPYSVRVSVDSKGTTVQHTLQMCFERMTSEIIRAVASGSNYAFIGKFEASRNEFLCDWGYGNHTNRTRFAGGVLVRRHDDKWEVSMHS